MDEHIFLSRGAADETVTLGVIEPLHSPILTICHKTKPFLCIEAAYAAQYKHQRLAPPTMRPDFPINPPIETTAPRLAPAVTVHGMGLASMPCPWNLRN